MNRNPLHHVNQQDDGSEPEQLPPLGSPGTTASVPDVDENFANQPKTEGDQA